MNLLELLAAHNTVKLAVGGKTVSIQRRSNGVYIHAGRMTYSAAFNLRDIAHTVLVLTGQAIITQAHRGDAQW